MGIGGKEKGITVNIAPATTARSTTQLDLPISLAILAALNPCPCVSKILKNSKCYCTPKKIRSYIGKVSGAVADRFGRQLELGIDRKSQILRFLMIFEK